MNRAGDGMVSRLPGERKPPGPAFPARPVHDRSPVYARGRGRRLRKATANGEQHNKPDIRLDGKIAP